MFPLAALVAYPVILRYTLLHRGYCTHEFTLLRSCDLFSPRKDSSWLERL